MFLALKISAYKFTNRNFSLFPTLGTGKTYVLIEIILQLAKHLPGSKILIATQSNTAANVVASRLIAINSDIGNNLVRVVSRAAIGKKSLPKELIKYSASVIHHDLDLEDDDKDADGNRQLTFENLAKYQIVVGTCVGLAVIFDSNLKEGHFTHVLIDEAGQCNGKYCEFILKNVIFHNLMEICLYFSLEPEAMIPISLIDANAGGQIIMAGDPQQLAPIVLNNHAKDRGLPVSMLQRYMLQYEKLQNIALVIK